MRSLLPLIVVITICLAARAGAQGVLINEIHYDPDDETRLEEFIELFNSSGAPVDVSGWYFSDGISYVFPAGTVIGPGEYLLIAEKPESIVSRFGAERVLGPFEGRLANDGERITLRNERGDKEDEVDYQVGFPWPLASGGKGSSMELIHPSLDNDLGGSWRASLSTRSLPEARVAIISSQDSEWRWRKGTSEASDPPSAWRAVDFVEDESWLPGTTSIGFGDEDDRTVIDDMLGNYTSIYLRRPFYIASAADIPSQLKIRIYVDDGCIAWLNGVEVARSHVPPGEKAYNDVARTNEARWEEFLLPNPGAYLTQGSNVLAIHALNVTVTNNDFSVDAELVIPARSELPPAPTPGEENSVWSLNAPPQIRQVAHLPETPLSGELIVVTARITDPEGVAGATLKYQIVPPGNYIPAYLALEPAELMARPTQPLPPNPAFEDPAGWTAVVLADDGIGADDEARDGNYTGLIPAQPNRTLIRYRITAEDRGSASVTVPYPDDDSLNFACFVHDGVPPYQASKLSVHPEGAGHIYPVDVLTSLPVYFLITRNSELARCIAYNGAWQLPKSNEAARDAFNWEGTFFYDGKVYDHIHYRLRQANDRYGGAGKRSWRIRFNKGNYLRAKDNFGVEYPTPWRTLNTGKMFDNKAVGNFGLTETLNDNLWNMMGVPANYMHTFHFRVIDAPDEVPAGPDGQYHGDFWGMALAIEDYDPRFVDAHGLPDGNLYKLKDGIFTGNDLKRKQGRYSVTTDADFQNIRANLRPAKDAVWLDQHVRYEKWYPYHAVVEAVRHYDFVPADSHSKNRAWFFEPAEGSPLGRLWTLPWDHDASWGPNWNEGIDYSKQAIFGSPPKAAFKVEYRNTIREFRDLLWQPDVIHAMIDDLAAIVAEFSRADRDRWRNAPADAGRQDFGALEAKVADMKRFAFVSWTGGSGPAVPAGGRATHLDNLSNAEGDAGLIPATPTVTAAGPAHFPIDRLDFETTPFSDPQGEGTFAAMKWRVGEVTARSAPFDRSKPRIHEWDAVWESGELAEFSSGIRVPLTAIVPGRIYRIRVKMQDVTGRWSHWSAPLEFTAGEPDGGVAARDHLRVTEIMYNPVDGGDLEYIELLNTSTEPLDLSSVRFTEGIQFSFAGSAVTSLGPGEYVVLVKSSDLFPLRYDASAIQVAGEFEGKLDNEGDEVVLMLGESLVIQRFTFDDSWYPDTDGQGHSLVIADPSGPPERWSERAGWHSSSAVYGSPGRADGPIASGLQLPGDITQDSRLDISDPVGLLGHLFLGDPIDLACDEDGSGGASLQLADVDGNGVLNLTDGIYILRYLFQAGPEPVLGTSCILMEGCPDTCR